MKIRLCACQFYHRVPQETLAAVFSAAQAAEIDCEIVPDLCWTAAKDHEKIAEIAAADVVLACQPRAVRSLLGQPETVCCIDIRSSSPAEIIAALALPQPQQRAGTSGPDLPVEKVYEKLPSDWIPWFPVIDADRCVQCKKCVDFCMFGVYSIDSDKVCVTRPDACKTDCPACARICPQNAIIFPKSEEELVNGSLTEPIKPSAEAKASFAERLRNRKPVRLFKEDD